MRLKEVSREVFVSSEPIVKVARQEIEFLKSRLADAPRGRVRLCAHKDSSDLLHEMMIVLAKDSYIRPHKHLQKSESFHVLEGTVDVVVFSDAGEITEVIELGELSSGKNFYYRLAEPRYHTLIIRSEYLVIHETTNGPFQKGDAIFAPWAPDEQDQRAARTFVDKLYASAREFLAQSKSR